MPKHIDLSGKKLGRLTIGEKKRIGRLFYWEAICDCGNKKLVVAGNLTRSSEPTRSCGCIQIEKLKSRSGVKSPSYKHGHAIGNKRSRTLRIWSGMIDRCYNKKNKAYKYYGERGITVCDRWHKFDNFLQDMGESPQNLSIERIDNEKGYSIENCKWVTHLEQVSNRRCNIYMTMNGETKILSRWALDYGLNYATLHSRIKTLGWDIERAIKTPVKYET